MPISVQQAAGFIRSSYKEDTKKRKRQAQITRQAKQKYGGAPRETLNRLDPEVRQRVLSGIQSRAAQGNRDARLQMIAFEGIDPVAPATDISSLSGPEKVLMGANKAVRGVGRAFIEAPTELGNMINYAASERILRGQLERGEIGFETYKKLTDEMSGKVNIDIGDKGGTIARKVGSTVAQTAADILTAGMAGTAVKQGGKQVLKTAGKVGFKQGAKVGAFYGGTEALQQDKVSTGDVIRGAATGGIAGGTLGAVIGSLGRRLSGGSRGTRGTLGDESELVKVTDELTDPTLRVSDDLDIPAYQRQPIMTRAGYVEETNRLSKLYDDELARVEKLPPLRRQSAIVELDNKFQTAQKVIDDAYEKGKEFANLPRAESGTPNARAEIDSQTWYRGTDSQNTKATDSFYSADETVAGDYGKVSKSKPQAQNPLVVSGKAELAEKMGYEGDPLAQRAGDNFDELAKQYAQSQGHDAIYYRSGSLEAPEMHVFNKSSDATAPIAQDYRFSASSAADQPTSRAKHFNETLRDTIEELEADPAYKADVEARGGGRVIGQAETYQKAHSLGPVPEQELFDIQQGGVFSAVDTVRAKATVDSIAKEYNDALMTGDAALIAETGERLKKGMAGYQVVTGETGRALNIQGTFVDEQARLAQKYQELVDSNGGRPPTPEQMAAWKEQVQTTLKRQMEEAAKAKNPEVVNTLRRIISGVEEYATAAKVSSPITHIRNIAGNTLTFLQRTFEQTIGVAYRAAQGKTGLGEAKLVFGSRAGWQQAGQKFWGIMKDAAALREGEVAETGGKLAREGFREAIPGKVGRAIRLPFKFLEAVDEFGKTVLRDSSLSSQAYELAWKEGARGNKLSNRIGELLEKPTESMLDVANKEALEYTFQSDLGAMGKVISKLQNLPGGRIFIPFIKTPTNIAKFQARRSVLGLISPSNYRDLFKGTAREQANAVARMSTGALLSFGTYQWVDGLYDDGRITGAVPDNPGERDIFYGQGKRPYSIKIGDKWFSYQSIQPVGMYLLQAVGLKEALTNNQSEDATRLASSMALTVAKGLSELPFVKGMNDMLEAVVSPADQGAKLFEQIATGFVPNFLRDITYWQDEIVRAPRNIQEQIMTMLPGQSQKVPARQDILGRDVKRDPDKLLRSVLRLGVTARDDKLLNALDEVGKATGYYPGFPSKTVRNRKLTDDEYQRYQKRAGEIFRSELERAVSSPQFTGADPEQKQKDIEGIVERAREQARDELFGAASYQRSERRRY